MTDANKGTTASVVERALADMKSAGRAWDDAVGALEAAVRRGAPWDECLPLFAAARSAEVGWRDESVEAVARVVGASLLETGHADVWRALFVLLLAKFDIWTGWNAGYDLGDEAAFVEEAGWWERDKGEDGGGRLAGPHSGAARAGEEDDDDERRRTGAARVGGDSGLL